jgi:hypothetical protein
MPLIARTEGSINAATPTWTYMRISYLEIKHTPLIAIQGSSQACQVLAKFLQVQKMEVRMDPIQSLNFL